MAILDYSKKIVLTFMMTIFECLTLFQCIYILIKINNYKEKMKFILVLFLLSAISCNSFLNCLIENPKVRDIAKDFMKAIKEKDFASVLPLALEKIPEMKAIVRKCWEPDTDEPLLQADPKKCQHCTEMRVNKIIKLVCVWVNC
jgi:hypothetical protein